MPCKVLNPRMFQFGYKEKKLWASSAKVRRHTNFNTNIHLVPRSGEGSKKKKWLHRSSGDLLDELKLFI